MATFWCHNAKTGEIFSYQQEGDLTDFPRGVFLAYGDYLTTGLRSLAEAKEWATQWGACGNCRATRSPGPDGNCLWCGTPVVFVPSFVQE